MNLQEQTYRIKQMMGLLIEQAETPVCSAGGCSGKYVGPEFDNTGDVAHKYSNNITQYVAAKLKELYRSGTYVKVDFKGIQMTTKGMGSGNVVYTVVIPFVGVSDKCEARTGFAHVGGWNHTPELNARKSEILNYIPSGKKENVVLNNELDVSQLTKTPEGLEEYWIQWKHRDYQSDCGGQTQQGNQQQNSGVNITSTDLSQFIKDIQIKSKGSSIDLNNVQVVLDTKTNNYSLKIGPGKTQINYLRLALNVRDDKTKGVFPSRDKILNDFPGAKSIKDGTFDGGTRDYSIIMIP